MKKLLWIVPLVLIAAWPVTTFFIGMNVEKGLDKFYEDATEKVAAMGVGTAPLQFNKKEFNKGFFSSEASTAVEFKDFPLSMFDVTVKTKINHGPLMFTSDGVKVGCSYAVSTLDLSNLPEDTRKDIEKAFDDEEPMVMGILTTFGQDVSVNLSMPPFKITEKEFEDDSETKVRFAGMNGTIEGSTKPDSPTTGSLKIGEFRISNEQRGTSISTAIATGELIMSDVRDGQMAAGTASMVLPEFKFKSETSEVAINDIAMKSESAIDDSKGTVGGFGRLEFASVTGTDGSGMATGLIEQLGKGGYIEYSIDGWDYAALMKFQESMNKFSSAQNKMMSGMMGDMNFEVDENGEPVEPKEDDEPAEELDMEKVMAEMQAAAKETFESTVALFQPGMTLDWRIKLGDGEGRGDIHLGVSYAEGAKPGSEAKTVGELVNAIVVETDARIAKAMLPEGMGEAMLADPVEQGMIEDRGDYYRATAEMKRGKVSVNGTELPIMDQFAPIMEQELSPDAFLENLMGGMMGGGKAPDMQGGGFPDGPDGFDPATPADAKGASPDPLKPDAAPPAPAPVPQ